MATVDTRQRVAWPNEDASIGSFACRDSFVSFKYLEISSNCFPALSMWRHSPYEVLASRRDKKLKDEKCIESMFRRGMVKVVSDHSLALSIFLFTFI